MEEFFDKCLRGFPASGKRHVEYNRLSLSDIQKQTLGRMEELNQWYYLSYQFIFKLELKNPSKLKEKL